MTQPEIEKSILEFWRQNSIFQKSLDKPSPKGNYVFYDGPPFATGTPHYGHIAASLIKDMVPRYFTMAGFHVARRWGWDCHGLPIENIVELEHGFKHKKDILAFGIDKFNEEARSKVLKYADEWRLVIERLGRWVDMKNGYRTMDAEYMESVWWVFKQLWDKGLIYEGFRSLHICPRCETTLSQSEVSEGYKEVDDLSAVVKFRSKNAKNQTPITKQIPNTNNQEMYFLAWTTTPWTLPGNAALAVREDIEYAVVRTKKEALSGSFARSNFTEQQGDLTTNNYDSTDKNFVNTVIVDKQNRSGGGPEGSRTPPGALSSRSAAPAAGPDRPDRQNELYHEHLVIAKTIFDKWLEEGKISGEIVATVKGRDLVGLAYEPLFNVIPTGHNIVSTPPPLARGGAKGGGRDPLYMGKPTGQPSISGSSLRSEQQEVSTRDDNRQRGDDKWRNAFKVYAADFVNTEEGTGPSAPLGTGIVHIAPAFGEDDMNLGKREHLPFIQHVRMDGTLAFGEKHQTPNTPPSPRLRGAGKHQENTNNQNSNFKSGDILWELNGFEVRPKDDPAGTDRKIIAYLAKRGLLFSQELYRHSYPHCWRCESPLLNYSTSSYFVAVTKIKERLLSQAEDIRWVPAHIKEGRFGQWLQNSRDWSISRQRFWGSVIPIWRCEGDKHQTPNTPPSHSVAKALECQRPRLRGAGKHQENTNNQNAKILNGQTAGNGCGHIVVIGSVAELESRSGKKVKDLHKHFVDDITFPCPECGGVMRRIPDVLDCWFESGAMPYATVPVPMLSNPALSRPLGTSPLLPKGKSTSAAGCSAAGPGMRDKAERDRDLAGQAKAMSAAGWPFPAQFIAEGVDQTRAWFYYLHVLGVALFGKAAFQNAVVNGIVLAQDGQKMSKRFSNYPDPMAMFDKYGADAVRYYLAASPVMRAEDLNFSEKGVEEVVKKVLLTLYNVLAFYQMYNSDPNKSELHPNDPNKIYVGDKHQSDTNESESHANDANDKKSNVNGQMSNVAHILDRWIVAKLNVIIRDVTAAYEAYDLNRAVRPLGEFINELSTWYLRRSRERFKGGFLSFRSRWTSAEESPLSDKTRSLADARACLERSVKDDSLRAIATLRHVLLELSILLAPVMPFTAEHIWRELHQNNQTPNTPPSHSVANPLRQGFGGQEALECQRPRLRGAGKHQENTNNQNPNLISSVHLQEWPKTGSVDEQLLYEMEQVRQMVELGLSKRAEAGIKVRQPLRSVTVKGAAVGEPLVELLRAELNVKEVKFVVPLSFRAPHLAGRGISTNRKTEIPHPPAGGFGMTKEAEMAIKPEELVVSFDVTISDELRAEGHLRELTRQINALRKKAGLTVGDIITLLYQTDSEELQAVFIKFADELKKSVIAKEIIKGDNDGDEVDVNGEKVKLSLRA